MSNFQKQMKSKTKWPLPFNTLKMYGIMGTYDNAEKKEY